MCVWVSGCGGFVFLSVCADVSVSVCVLCRRKKGGGGEKVKGEMGWMRGGLGQGEGGGVRRGGGKGYG